MDNSDYNQALEILKALSEENYSEASDKVLELYYLWGNDLISQEKYLDAYDKLNLAGDYLDTKLIIADLKDYIYYSAIDYYQMEQYQKSETWFNKIGNYLDSNAYQILIDAHTNPYYSDINKLKYLIGFEDAAELVVSTHTLARAFLMGTWRGDSHYFIMKADGYIKYDIPWINYGDYYRIENGFLLLFKEESYNTTKPMYMITVINENCIQIFAFKNSRTYTLYR